MYQSIWSFNIPSSPSVTPPGIWTFGIVFVQIPPWAKKLFKCPNPQENYRDCCSFNFVVDCKLALHMGFCFQIARGRVRGGEPAMVLVRFEFCLLFRLTDLSPHVIAWLNKENTVTHSNRKTGTIQADISVKKSENYCLKPKPSMGTSFPNFPYMI